MSTRIIIEKDGERYVANDLTARFIDGVRAWGIENNISYDYISSTYTRLTPVERTDNGEVIARLEADNKRLHEATIHLNRSIERRDAQIRVLQKENAKLREALKPVLACKCNFDISWAFNDGTLLAYSVPMCDAVRKAQEIMKGEKK